MVDRLQPAVMYILATYGTGNSTWLRQARTYYCRNLGIKEMIIGGANEDWPVPNRSEIALDGITDPDAANPSAPPE